MSCVSKVRHVSAIISNMQTLVISLILVFWQMLHLYIELYQLLSWMLTCMEICLLFAFFYAMFFQNTPDRIAVIDNFCYIEILLYHLHSGSDFVRKMTGHYMSESSSSLRDMSNTDFINRISRNELFF